MGHTDQDLDQIHLSFENDSKKIKENQDRVDSHQNRINANLDLITELQNETKKIFQILKMKAENEDIDSLNNLVNDLYEKF